MSLLSPTDVTSNKICQWPVAQQVIAIAMLHKIYSLFKTAVDYFIADNHKIFVQMRHCKGIVSAMDALEAEKAQLQRYIDQLKMIQNRTHLKAPIAVPTQADRDQNLALQKPIQDLIAIQSKRVADCQKIFREKMAARQADLTIPEQEVEAARIRFQADKDYLKVALKRMVPIWGTLVSRQALEDLQKAAPAA